MRNFLTYNQSEAGVAPATGALRRRIRRRLDLNSVEAASTQRAFAEGGRAMLGQAAYGASLNFFIEFSAEINRKLGARK